MFVVSRQVTLSISKIIFLKCLLTKNIGLGWKNLKYTSYEGICYFIFFFHDRLVILEMKNLGLCECGIKTFKDKYLKLLKAISTNYLA